MSNEKGSESSKADKKGKERGKKKIPNGQWQKKNWLMGVRKIKIIYIFVPNHEEMGRYEALRNFSQD